MAFGNPVNMNYTNGTGSGLTALAKLAQAQSAAQRAAAAQGAQSMALAPRGPSSPQSPSGPSSNSFLAQERARWQNYADPLWNSGQYDKAQAAQNVADNFSKSQDIYYSQDRPVLANEIGSQGRLKSDSNYSKGLTAVGYSQTPNARNYGIDQGLYGVSAQGYNNAAAQQANYGNNQDYLNFLASRNGVQSGVGNLQQAAAYNPQFNQARNAQMQNAYGILQSALAPQQSVVDQQTALQQAAARNQALSQLAASRGNNPGAAYAAQMGASNAEDNIAANSLPARAQEANNQWLQRLSGQQAAQSALQGIGSQDLQSQQAKLAGLQAAGQLSGQLGTQDLQALQLRNQNQLGLGQLGAQYANMGMTTNTNQMQANQAYDAATRQTALQKLAMLQGQKVDPSIFQQYVLPALNVAGTVGGAIAGLV